MTRVSPMSMACEVIKATRDRWMTRGELAKATGASEVSVSHWVDEYVAQGMLKQRKRERAEGSTGYPPIEFTLAPEWIGPRLAPPQDGSDQASASVGKPTEPRQGY